MPIRVLVVDGHPALRAGLAGLLGQEDDVVLVGALDDHDDVLRTITEQRADVVILDYALEHGDGLRLCFRVKQLARPPRVVLYSAYVDQVFAVPAALAQADAIVAKSAPVDDLLAIVRGVHAGELCLRRPDAEAMWAASARLAPEDLSVAGMLFSRVSLEDIAATLGTHPGEVRSRALRIIGTLHGRAPRPAEAALG